MHSTFEILNETGTSGPELISLDDLKLALGIEGTEDDATLEAAIAFQSRIIAEYCDRRLGYAEAVETFTFDRYTGGVGEAMQSRQALTLRLYPVIEIFEVAADGTVTTDYEFDTTSGRIWSTNGGYWSGTVAITYAGGYELPDGAPARLQKAVIEAVNEGRTSGTRDPTIREVAHGDTRVSYFTNAVSSASAGFLSASVENLIKPFRRLGVG